MNSLFRLREVKNGKILGGKRTGSQYDGDFADYIYDFYPEMLNI